MRLLIRIIGGLAVVMIFFWGTLLALDITNPALANNRLRGDHVKQLTDAIEKYRQARGTYPAVSGPVDDLKKDLVDGGFLASIPNDPKASAGGQYRYTGGASFYGLLVNLEREPWMLHTKPASTCVVGVRIKGTGAWGDPPACSFQ
jgi:hypothetical protein